MFFPIPIRFHDGREFHAIPAVNALLIAANVLLFFFGWHPHVGPGTGLFSVVAYAFGHAGVYHLVGNMLALLVFGTPVNRRLGNGWYFVVYLGTVLFMGIFARLLCHGNLIGASGAIFAVIAIALMLFPSALIEIAYFALFPVTLIAGVLSPPKHWVFWFIRWDVFSLRAYWGIFLVPFLEIWGALLGRLELDESGSPDRALLRRGRRADAADRHYDESPFPFQLRGELTGGDLPPHWIAHLHFLFAGHESWVFSSASATSSAPI